ncbi:MAG: hypothetical protein ACOYUK_04025 [Patescibacteria group bacterium]
MEQTQKQVKTDMPADIAPTPEAKSSIAKPKKRRGWLITLIVFAVIVLGIALGISATGLYTIPVLSSIFKTDQPIDLGVSNDPKHLETLYAQVPLQISGTRTDSVANMFDGEIAVDMRGTSEEITAWLKRFEGDNPVFSDVQVNMIEGGMEVSGMVNEYIQAPGYVKASVTATSPKSIDLIIHDAKVGRIAVPDQYLDDIERFFEDQINTRMASIEGFSIETLEYHSGYGDFVGTLPATARSHDRGWSALLVE